MRALAVLFALLVPAGQVMAAMHLHCALEHPLGRTTPHAAGDAAQAGERQELAGDDRAHRHAHARHGGVESGHRHAHHDDGHRHAGAHVHDDSRTATLFDDHHHHQHGGTASSHAGCCIGGAGGAMLCGIDFLGVDVRVEQFALPMLTRAYISPFHEPPPRPQWRAHTPA